MSHELSLLFILFFTKNLNLADTVYYVDSINGEDNRSGKTPKSAWKSVHRVTNAMSGYGVKEIEVGSKILFIRGGVFRDDSLIIRKGGTEKSHMLIGSYGDKNLPKPLFQNVDIYIGEPLIEYIDIEDIRLNDISDGTAVSFNQKGLKNITISRLDINNTKQNAIFLTSVDGYIIQDCNISNIGLSGIVIYGADNKEWPLIKNGIIRRNQIKYTNPIYGDGITLHKSDNKELNDIGSNHLLEKNSIGFCGENAYDIDSGDSIKIIKCEGYNSGLAEVSIENASNVTIEESYFHNGDKNGFDVGKYSNNIIIRRNVIKNMKFRPFVIGDSSHEGEVFYKTIHDVKIYNNWVYHSSNHEIIRVSNGSEKITYKDNISISTTDNRFIYYEDDLTPENTDSFFENNIWHRPNSNSDDFAYINGKDMGFFKWQTTYEDN